jgi:hypothetical protein
VNLECLSATPSPRTIDVGHRGPYLDDGARGIPWVVSYTADLADLAGAPRSDCA